MPSTLSAFLCGRPPPSLWVTDRIFYSLSRSPATTTTHPLPGRHNKKPTRTKALVFGWRYKFSGGGGVHPHPAIVVVMTGKILYGGAVVGLLLNKRLAPRFTSPARRRREFTDRSSSRIRSSVNSPIKSLSSTLLRCTSLPLPRDTGILVSLSRFLIFLATHTTPSAFPPSLAALRFQMARRGGGQGAVVYMKNDIMKAFWEQRGWRDDGMIAEPPLVSGLLLLHWSASLAGEWTLPAVANVHHHPLAMESTECAGIAWQTIAFEYNTF